MKTKETAITFTETSPAAASTVVATQTVKQSTFWRSEKLQVVATLTGATGGTLDVYVQAKVASNAWIDLIHFPQITAAAAAKSYIVTLGGGSTSVLTAVGTDSTPSVALSAGTANDVIPPGDVRVVFVAGSGTSAGASQTVVFTPISSRTG